MSIPYLSAEEFDRIIKDEHQSCVIVFSKETCGVCQKLAPIVEKVSANYADTLPFYGAYVSDPEVLKRFKELKLLGVPQTVFFLNGEKQKALPGGIDEAMIQKEAKKILNANKGFFAKLKSFF